MTAAPMRIETDLPPLARRPGLVAAIGAVVVVVLAVLSIGVGSVWIPPAEVWAALAGDGPATAQTHIVVGLRLPRTLIAAVAGGMLALAGTVLQSATRNDLADPSLVGVSGGAVLAVVATLSFTGWDAVPAPWSTLLAFAGGTAASALIWLLSWSEGSPRSARLVLDGVLISAVLSALVSVLLILDGALFGTVLRWVVGSLNGRVWQDWAALWPVAVVAVPLGLLLARLLDALWLGDEIAAATGVRPVTARGAALAVSTLLTAGAVSVVGSIGFIGLVAPHIARLLVGERPARVLLPAVLAGGALLVGADLLAQTLSLLMPVSEVGGRTALPAGAITAIVGGPVLFALLARRTR